MFLSELINEFCPIQGKPYTSQILAFAELHYKD
jgi:hypothetical protein